MKRRILILIATVLCFFTGLACAEILTLPLDFSPGMKPLGNYPAFKGEAVFDHYKDPSITADYETARSDKWPINYYMARIRIANGSQIRTAAAVSFDKKALAPTEVMARRVNAIVAINGDYFTGRAGRYVLRQGQVFREAMAENQDLLLIDEDGDFHIILAEEKPENMDRTVIDGKRVNNALCFGPALDQEWGDRRRSCKGTAPVQSAQRGNPDCHLPDGAAGLYGYYRCIFRHGTDGFRELHCIL